MSAELSLTIFFMSTPIFLVLLPFWVEKNGQCFNKNPVIHLIIKRCCFLLSAWLMTLCTAIIYSISQTASYNISNAVILYIQLFGWGGYLLMFWIGFTTLRDAITLKMIMNKEKRYGED